MSTDNKNTETPQCDIHVVSSSSSEHIKYAKKNCGKKMRWC